MDANYCTFIGHLARDPEMRYVNVGGEQKAVCDFAIGNNPTPKRDAPASFFEITTWGKVAENCQKYLHKGDQVFIQCQARQEKWQDKTSGQNRTAIRFTAHHVQFLKTKGFDQGGGQEGPHGAGNRVEGQGGGYNRYQGPGTGGQQPPANPDQGFQDHFAEPQPEGNDEVPF